MSFGDRRSFERRGSEYESQALRGSFDPKEREDPSTQMVEFIKPTIGTLKRPYAHQESEEIRTGDLAFTQASDRGGQGQGTEIDVDASIPPTEVVESVSSSEDSDESGSDDAPPRRRSRRRGRRRAAKRYRVSASSPRQADEDSRETEQVDRLKERAVRRSASLGISPDVALASVANREEEIRADVRAKRLDRERDEAERRRALIDKAVKEVEDREQREMSEAANDDATPRSPSSPVPSPVEWSLLAHRSKRRNLKLGASGEKQKRVKIVSDGELFARIWPILKKEHGWTHGKSSDPLESFIYVPPPPSDSTPSGVGTSPMTERETIEYFERHFPAAYKEICDEVRGPHSPNADDQNDELDEIDNQAVDPKKRDSNDASKEDDDSNEEEFEDGATDVSTLDPVTEDNAVRLLVKLNRVNFGKVFSVLRAKGWRAKPNSGLDEGYMYVIPRVASRPKNTWKRLKEGSERFRNGKAVVEFLCLKNEWRQVILCAFYSEFEKLRSEVDEARKIAKAQNKRKRKTPLSHLAPSRRKQRALGSPPKQEASPAVVVPSEDVWASIKLPSKPFFVQKFFVLTGFRSQKSERNVPTTQQLTLIVEAAGGVVVESVTNALSPLYTIARPMAYRTHKYVYTFAAESAKCVHYHWIYACCKANAFVSPEEYRVPLGSFDFGQHPLRAEPTVLARLAKMVFVPHGEEKQELEWKRIFACLGAECISLAEVGARSTRDDFGSSEYVVVLGESPDAKKNELPLLRLNSYANVRLVTVDWLKDCLRFDEIVDAERSEYACSHRHPLNQVYERRVSSKPFFSTTPWEMAHPSRATSDLDVRWEGPPISVEHRCDPGDDDSETESSCTYYRAFKLKSKRFQVGDFVVFARTNNTREERGARFGRIEALWADSLLKTCRVKWRRLELSLANPCVLTRSDDLVESSVDVLESKFICVATSPSTSTWPIALQTWEIGWRDRIYRLE